MTIRGYVTSCHNASIMEFYPSTNNGVSRTQVCLSLPAIPCSPSARGLTGQRKPALKGTGTVYPPSGSGVLVGGTILI